MVTYNMSTEPVHDKRSRQRLSGGTSDNQSKPTTQSPPSYYAAPNHFATSKYNADVNPVAASAGSRRFGSRRYGSSSYALPSPLPTSMEMYDLSEPSQSPYNIPTIINNSNNNTLPPQVTQSVVNPSWYTRPWKSGLWFPCILSFLLSVTSLALHPPHSKNQPWNTTRWSRPGQDETLLLNQVIFTTLPLRYIWACFLAVLMLNVWVLQIVYWFGGFAARDDSKGKMCTKMKPLVFVVAVALEAVFMWGWLLFFI